jgi:hypothetical protein
MALYAFDGTWNRPDKNAGDDNTETNVIKFFRHMETWHPGSAEYQDGVGTRLGVIGSALGGLLGAGGRKRVRAMLKCLEKRWAAGDETIDVIGFSRGAALALHFCNEVSDLRWNNAQGIPVTPKIRFLGLWDTVPAFGIPGVWLDLFKDFDPGWRLTLAPNVETCAHALALDERRQAFDIHRLDIDHVDARVTEVWFAGVHGDIGGSKNNPGRNDITLLWMMEQANAAGVPLELDAARAALRPDPKAPISSNSKIGDNIQRRVFPGDTLHESVGRRLAAGETVSFAVDSTQRWHRSGIMVKRGERLTFRPDPAGRWKDKKIVCDATGWPDESTHSKAALKWFTKLGKSWSGSHLKRVRSANWFEMVVTVGMDEDAAAPIGSQQHATDAWVAPASGPLYFFANDAALRIFGIDFYDNNEGEIRVKITRFP